MALSAVDLQAIHAVGKQLKEQLNQILLALPNHAKSIAGLTEYLSYNRSNAQRVIKASQCLDFKLVLTACPGVAALREFSHLLQIKSLESLDLNELNQTIDQMEQIIRQHARSHAELKRLLSAQSSKKSSGKGRLATSQLRKQHFEASSQLIGNQIEQMFTCHILTENRFNPDYLHEVAIVSKNGVRLGEQAPPFVQFYTHPNNDNFTGPARYKLDDRVKENQFEIGIIDAFSSDFFADSYTEYSTSNSGLVFANLPREQAFNASFLFSNPDELVNPMSNESRCSSTSISIKNPTRHLAMMVFIEKSLDRQSNVNVGCYSGNQKVEEGKLKASEMWTEKLPGFPELKVLANGAPQMQSINAIEVSDQIDFLFQFAGLNQADFACYLMTVDYPIWSSTYRIYFEHA
ncbi:hypothetical protein HR060_09975 [Catenovulum sp. SM1970]|uniref:hypothetical protein n=1 Tax=Marinifaba aquimaris TaxID=2741323 RepID=UPI00157358F1|nr:hypothetical protein [Marinifaba aquimaris]NTS77190.1 hypothetical protein [Marinifaba aquimaris]